MTIEAKQNKSVGCTLEIKVQSDAGSGFAVIFKKDYIGIKVNGCPDCCPYAYQVILPPLLGRVPVVAIFDSIGICGRPMIEKLSAEGVIILINKSSHESQQFIGGRFINTRVELPDNFKELMEISQIIE